MAPMASKKKATKKTAAKVAAKKTTGKKEIDDPKKHQSLEQLILDKTSGKYEIVEVISYWAKHLRQQEEHRHLTQTEILELAMREVLNGTVSESDLKKKIAAGASSNGSKRDSEKSKKKS